MGQLINVNGIHTVKYLDDYSAGKFRFISKSRSGMFTVVDARPGDNARYLNNLEGLLTAYKKGALYSVEFCPEGGDYYLTVFARVGKKIRLIDEEILKSLTVGTINAYWYDTNLHSQEQYTAVGAANWSHRAYVDNRKQSVEV
jgi:hypothetical protein